MQLEMSEIKVSRKTFDAACVFAGVSVLQFAIPSPLDYFLLPTAAAYWFVQSGQDSWMIDYAYENAHVIAGNLKHIAQEFIERQRQNAAPNDDDDDEQAEKEE